MERAVNIAIGITDIEFYQKQGPIYLKTPLVTIENVDEWIEIVSAIMPD